MLPKKPIICAVLMKKRKQALAILQLWSAGRLGQELQPYLQLPFIFT